jgi:hypothetical protein
VILETVRMSMNFCFIHSFEIYRSDDLNFREGLLDSLHVAIRVIFLIIVKCANIVEVVLFATCISKCAIIVDS